MADIYQSFLRSPSVSSLAPNASLHYITTTTSIHEPEAIIKHLQAQAKQVEKRSENVLSCMESGNGVCLETETTFKFVRSGGAILPQMDDNLLADMEAVCAMIHVVQLDANRKISQIRLYWDQATVLKQVEAIGKSGRNWPIRSGQEQSRLITQSTKASGQSQATSGVTQTSTNGPTSNEQSQSAAEKQRPLSNVTNMAADRRREDMDSHSNIGQYTDPKKPSAHQARSDQTSSWSFQDMTEATPAKTQKIYKTAGDGMGGKANSRFWEIGGDEEEPEQYGGKGGVKQVYKTAGNGMGGRKGYGLSWSIGQDEDES